MPRLAIPYADRVFSPSIASQHISACLQELEFLYHHSAYTSTKWNRGQFEQIAVSLELRYGSAAAPSPDLRTPLQRRYRGVYLTVQVPVFFFFRMTVAIEELMTDPDVRTQTMAVPTLRALWKRIIVVSSPQDAAIFAWQQMQCPNSVACVTSWRFGRRWLQSVDSSAALRAQVALELLLLTAADADIAATAFADFEVQFPAPALQTLAPDLLFEPQHATYALAPAALAPRHYPGDAGDVLLTEHGSPAPSSSFWCRFCPDVAFHDEAAWLQHLAIHGGLPQYRSAVLAFEAARWPSAVDQRLVRHCMQEYASEFWTQMATPPRSCAVCTLPHTATDVHVVNLRDPPFDLAALHVHFSARGYVAAHASLYPDPCPARFLGLPLATVLANAVPVPLPGSSAQDGWLLHLDPLARDHWRHSCADVGRPLHCALCVDCNAALRRSPPRLPARSLANGNLCLPLPDHIRDLTFAEKLFVARGFTVNGCILCLALPLLRIVSVVFLAMAFPFHRMQRAFFNRCPVILMKLPSSPYVPESLKKLLRSMEVVSGAVPYTDAAHEALQAALKQVNLAHAVAADPVAIARAFHHHVQMFFSHLLNCTSAADIPNANGLACRTHGGILGPVAAYFAVTEPQLRGSLHLHLLLHLYSFTTPSAFAAQLRAALPVLAARLLTWTSSLVSTSLESLPSTWYLPLPTDQYFRSLQSLPYSAKQVQRLQLARNPWDADAAANSWFYGSPMLQFQPVEPWADPFGDLLRAQPSFLPWPRTYLQAPSDTAASSWCQLLLYDLRHSAVQCCLHDCRPRTCHKGFLGQLGFCRLGYWHWQQVSASLAEPVWQRCHGLPLLQCATVGQVPPHETFLLTERYHPFHTRFHPAILATVKCNHDISVMLWSLLLLWLRQPRWLPITLQLTSVRCSLTLSAFGIFCSKA
eukprot:s1504_g5.t1